MRLGTWFAAGAWVALATSWAAAADPPPLPLADPSSLGLDPARLALIRPLAEEAIAAGKLPGCVVAIGRAKGLAFLQPIGNRQVEPTPSPAKADGIYDLASLTKPIATAACIGALLEDGRLRLGERAAGYRPSFAGQGKERVTLEQLLTHQSGLIADNPLDDYAGGAAAAWEKIDALPLPNEPGAKFVYSDVGFLVLGEVVRAASGEPLDVFAQKRLFGPLGMRDTAFRPPAEWRDRCAPTEKVEGQWLCGKVHDPRAAALGGVAGHAGLFSTGADLSRFAAMLLRGGEFGGRRVLHPRTVALLTTPRPVAGGGRRGLGWDARSGYSTNRSDLYSDRAFGHGGFTGTGLWIDPELDLFVVFLSNRLHPDGKGNVNELIARIGSVAVSALANSAAVVPKLEPVAPPNVPKLSPPPAMSPPPPAAPLALPKPASAPKAPASAVLCGVDVLERDGFALLRGKKVGLIANHTARTWDGRSTVDVLAKAPGVTLAALFSPEHGLRGELDQNMIPDSVDPQTGLPVYSLYGKERAPSASQLRGLDMLAFDIQDAGTRFYTYISTMKLAQKAAAANGVGFIVLDRPNPLGGAAAGPMLDADKESFVGCHPLPVRHGLTVGELAKLFAADLGLPPPTVVTMAGWQRAMAWDATGLPWRRPSPNLRTPAQALLYPGVGLLEFTNVSVGRGTDAPFELVGAPWVDSGRLLEAARKSPGASATVAEFTPTSSRFAGKLCKGVRLRIADAAAFEPLRLGLELAAALRAHGPAWEIGNYAKLLGNAATFAAFQAGASPDVLERGWRPGVEAFRARSRRFQLYP